MYYHVWIEYRESRNKSNKNEYLFDLTEKEKILKDILKPYKSNKQLIINGRFLDKEDVLRIQVVKTSKSTKELLNIAYSRLAPGVICVYHKEHVAFDKSNSTDITTELLDTIEENESMISGESIANHLHSKIKEVALQKYLDGYYADAVEAGIKEINSRLKKMYKKFKTEELDGADLFAKVFLDDADKTLLKVSDLSTQSGKDEQKGYRFLFMGMWFALRNPKAHENVFLSQDEAYDRLIFISLLMKKIDKAFQYTFEE